MLKTLAFLQGKKWTTMTVSRTYFGNWVCDPPLLNCDDIVLRKDLDTQVCTQPYADRFGTAPRLFTGGRCR